MRNFNFARGPQRYRWRLFPPGQSFFFTEGRNTPFIETCLFMSFPGFPQIAAEIQRSFAVSLGFEFDSKLRSDQDREHPSRGTRASE